jgi:hypothetical protein
MFFHVLTKKKLMNGIFFSEELFRQKKWVEINSTGVQTELNWESWIELMDFICMQLSWRAICAKIEPPAKLIRHVGVNSALTGQKKSIQEVNWTPWTVIYF